MRNYIQHFECVPEVSSVNSMTVSSFQIISQRFFFSLMFCCQLKHCSIFIVFNEDFEKNVVGRYRKYNSDCFYGHILQALQTKYMV